MKTYFSIIFVFTIIATTAVLFFVDPKQNELDSIITTETNWTIKEKEIRSRLLSVPILLYHNIDGKGVFSIELDTLREHFQLLKDNDVRVIPLSELINRLDDPEPFDEKVAVITFDDGFFSMYTRLLPIVKEFEYPVTLFVYTDFIYPKANMNLTWNRLKEMEDSGIEVECHSISHNDLSALSVLNNELSKKILFEELYLSKRIIELYLDNRVKYFAFPYGRYDLNLIEMCRNSGYERTFSTDYGSNIITRNNYCLKRQHIKKNFSLDYIKHKIE